MKNLKLAHWLSLDVAIGAVAGYRFFTKMAKVDFDLYVAFLLFCIIQMIYVFDRFFDLNFHPSIETERHQFHAKNKHFLKVYLAILFIISIFLLFKLNLEVLKFGVFVSFCMFVYYLILKFLPNVALYLKEILVAIIYTGTIAGLAYCFIKPSWLEKLIIADYALVLLQSLVLYKIYEGFKSNLLVLFVLSVPFLLLAQNQIIERFYLPFFTICSLMSLVISAVYIFRKYLSEDKHRIPVELTFWLGLFCK